VLEYESGFSDAPADASDNAPFLRQLTSSTATPPEATSTPQRSMQMPSQLQYQSNLLDQELDMQDAMSFDSYEEDSAPSQRSRKFFVSDNQPNFNTPSSIISSCSYPKYITFCPSTASLFYIRLEASFV
jgi:hypothetical protein